jgi:hypothetical protein
MTTTANENRDTLGVTFVENGPVDVDQLNRLYSVVGWDRANMRTAEDTVRMLEVSRFCVSAHCSDLGVVGVARFCGDRSLFRFWTLLLTRNGGVMASHTECMRRVVAHLRQSQCVTVTLTACTGLDGFYQRFDFKIFKDVARVWAPRGRFGSWPEQGDRYTAAHTSATAACKSPLTSAAGIRSTR